MAASQYQEIILADSPACFLPCNDASGDLIDITGNGFDMAVFGSPQYNNTSSTVNGLGGFACTSNAGYAICRRGGLPFGDGWAVEYWVATIASTSSWVDSTYRHIVSFPDDRVRRDGYSHNITFATVNYNSGYTGFNMHMPFSNNFNYSTSTERDDANSFQGSTGGGTTIIPSVGGNAATMTRSYCVISVPRGGRSTHNATTDQATAWYYVNGVVVATNQSSLPTHPFYSNDNYAISIFGSAASASTVNWGVRQMWISNIAVYDYPLTSAQITRHYQAGIGTLTGNRVAGSTLLDGVATGGFLVYVHRRDTGALIGRGVSNGSGAFSINVGSYSGQVYAIAFDTVSGQTFNAQVFDLITPST